MIAGKTPYEEIFGVPPDPQATQIGDAKHAIGAAREQMAINLQQQAAINIRYAEAIEATITSRGYGSAYMAQLHRTCAAKKLAQADQIFPPNDTGLLY